MTLVNGPACDAAATARSAPLKYTPAAAQLALWLSLLIPIINVIGITPAQAHVKWFAEYDVTKPPLPIGGVIDGRFVYFFLTSVVTIYVFFWSTGSYSAGTFWRRSCAASRWISRPRS